LIVRRDGRRAARTPIPRPPHELAIAAKEDTSSQPFLIAPGALVAASAKIMNHNTFNPADPSPPRPADDESESAAADQSRPYYEIVRGELSRNIRKGSLPLGVVLLEGPIANLLGVSRGPVKRALELLAEDGLIHRFEGRGYLVGPSDARLRPKRLNLPTLNLDVSGDIQAYAQRAAWQRIYGEVAESVVACTPFGAYQISEAAMCQHFDVSRTVARDVLARLNHDGLIEKDRWSHWTAGPLTARDVNDHFEMRRILEPAALPIAANLGREIIEAMLRRVEDAAALGDRLTVDQLDLLERDLHESCISNVANRRLAAAIRQSRLPEVINRLFGRHVGLHEVDRVLAEYRGILDHLLKGSRREAAAALEAHLDAGKLRTRARLKVLSVFAIQPIAPYLSPLIEGQSPAPSPTFAGQTRRRAAPRARPTLRVLGRREILLEPIRQQALSDLGFDIRFEMVDGIEEIQQAVTRPDSFDVYHQWHTVDLMWTAQSIRPIEIDRIPAWAEIAALAESSEAGGPVCGDLFRQLYVQADGRLDAAPTASASMMPTIYGMDSLGYLRDIRSQLRPNEPDSWAWLLDERWRGKVAMLRDPTLGMIEAALAVEGAGLVRFDNLANLSIEEIDAIIGILKEKKRSGHFRGLWETYEDAAKLMERGGVVVQSIFSPAITRLRRRGVDVASANPVEGCRGWHSDICLSSRTDGALLDAAYAYLNWWTTGPAGAILARQGYYMSTRDCTRRFLSDAEWDYWYEGKAAVRDLPDPYGDICVRAGEAREGGSCFERMSRVRVWNTVMDDHNYLARRWNEFLNA
jgi:putative spermidine/putrescine transport system substrate-binding protein